MNQKIIQKIVERTGLSDIIQILTEKISPTELQSLLLKIFEINSKKTSQKEILKRYESSRFLQPSSINPITFKKLDLKIFSYLPDGFETIELSPLAPLGTSSVMSPVHQNNIVSTNRNNEVAADATNILALECAKRRKKLHTINNKSSETVKLCSSQRLVRAQPFENENLSAHFSVVALCTAGRDQGNDRFEKVSLLEHLQFYIDVIDNLIVKSEVKSINIKFYDFNEEDNKEIYDYIENNISLGKHMKIIKEENSKFGKNYYKRLRFMIGVTNHDNREFDYVDGGFTDWTAKLLSNKKERLLTSGIGTEFLLKTMKVLV